MSDPHRPWHITSDNVLMLEPGTGELDKARGYYDPNHNEIVVTREAINASTRRIDSGINRPVMRLLCNAWPLGDIRSEPD